MSAKLLSSTFQLAQIGQRKALQIVGGAMLFWGPVALAQQIPPTSEKPWTASPSTVLSPDLQRIPEDKYRLAPDRVYKLSELVDLAEAHNPETRAAWQAAKQQAGNLKVARSELFPTLAATAMGQTLQTGVLLYDQFALQNQGILQGAFQLTYTLLDFGARQERIRGQQANLANANFNFNDTHRRVIFQTMSAYYQLLNALGQRRAAEVNLENARAVQAAAEARLEHGLATLPDVLQARSAAAQADFELQSAIGVQETASGDLATVVAASPASQFQVEGLEALALPANLAESVEGMMRRALAQRPDLLARLADVQGAHAEVQGARSEYYPNLGFQGNWGRLRAFGEQPPFPGTYAAANVYNAQLTLSWTIFDGGRRRGDLDAAHAAERRSEAEADAARDRISDEVWRSYSDAKTALKQRQAAQIFLEASTTAFQADLESYNYGVRNLLDLLAAQRSLAQARSADISASTRVLTAFADLAFRTGDILRNPGRTRP
jgi:outer membrane protein